MNAGAYGSELRDVLTEVTFLDEAGEYRTLPAAALELSYRHSIFEERPGCVIVEAVLTLTPGEETAIRAAMEDYMSRRREKQPLEYGSAGSTFKRPVGNYASALVDQCGLKGLSIGGAEVSKSMPASSSTGAAPPPPMCSSLLPKYSVSSGKRPAIPSNVKSSLWSDPGGPSAGSQQTAG